MKNITMITMLFLSMTYAVTTTTEVVVDSKTKLEWQNQTINKTETKGWEEAIAYCEDLELDGKTDWRLPNINELKSLIDYRKSSPAIRLNLEATTPDGYELFWSTTRYINKTTRVFTVQFSDGESYFYISPDKANFRCVRDY